MRVVKPDGEFKVKAISGNRTVLIALDCPEDSCNGLLGFGFKREAVGAAVPGKKWLRSLKVFKSVVPDPKNARDPKDPNKPRRFDTSEFPIQSFLWSDYTADPGTLYKFTVVPMCGKPGKLEQEPGIDFEIRTEEEFADGHGIWFNRGAIASQIFAREFQNKAPPEPDNPESRETQWLSRGLLEACLRFINDTPKGDGLRIAAYEFTYKPILDALRKALERGVDVRIIYDDTKGGEEGKGEPDTANEKAIKKAGIPEDHDGEKVLYPRKHAMKIPHNKFIVRLKNGSEPVSVWTGSTNFSSSGFLGQTNVGHLVEDKQTAIRYLDYWEALAKDMLYPGTRSAVMELTPHPPAVVSKDSITPIFSPRPKSEMLKWYGNRIRNSMETVMLTTPFGIKEALLEPITEDRDILRFLLMEKPPNDDVKAQLTKDRDLQYAYGSVLGEMYVFKDGEPTTRERIEGFELDKWMLKEDHFRHQGFVFFVHTKFLLIDPLSNDPLVCCGSANFTKESVLNNDENMLLFRGNKRIADIYATEFDRIFRHFYMRKTANEIEEGGGEAAGAFLDETDGWTKSYFRPGAFKSRRREMFFADPDITWVSRALGDT